MKTLKALSFLITLFLAFNAYSQKVDFVNAPKNPLPLGVNLEKTQLKGDVFQHNLTFYDTNGKRLDLEKRKHISYDQLNRPISITYPNETIKEYKYDASGNLIYDDGIIYKYDNQNRIIKANYNWEIVEYSYTKQGDIIIVTMTHKAKDKAPTTQIEYYNKGVLTARKKGKERKKTFFKYKYDEKGNLIESMETDAAGNLINQDLSSIIYHSEYKEFNKNAVLKKTTGDLNLKGGVAIPHLYINGKLDFTNLWNKFNNDYIFYNPLTSKYYVAKNAFNESIALNQNIPFKPLIEGENILISDGKTVLLIEQGTSTMFANREWKYEAKYKNIIVRDTKSGDVYFVPNALGKDTNETKAYHAISMNTKDSEVWYIPNTTKKGVNLYVKGEEIKGYGVAGYIDGSVDFVITTNGKPTYVLSNYSNSKPQQFSKGRYFNATVDKVSSTSNTNSTTSQNKSSTASCITGNCADGYGTYIYESGAKVEGFFKNGKLDGYGEFIYANGDTYNGNYLVGQLDGYGIYHWKQKNLLYYGHWKDTKQHGYGYFVKNGETVEAGIYNEGKLVTNLLTDFSNGKSSGNCLGNCTNGYGSITYNQGDVYEGLFKNGKPYKAGTYMWTNGNSYMGDWDESGKINYTGQFFTDTYVYKGAFAHNGFITGLGVKLDKKTNTKSYGEFKSGKLVVDYANSHTSAATTTNNSTASKQAEKAMLNSANLLIKLYYKSNSEFKKIVVKQHNNFTQTMSIDKLNKLHALFIKHLFQLDKVVAHRYLLYLPNPYANANTGKILTELSNEERTFMREESKRFSSQYKLKEQYVPKN
ncbi:hypothetical protein FUA26_04660 [Seonamhaeicola algicola]|uniref:Uncharacterized protein n=1 Tax=Seonamhaeicola algicola TaxID=1719036 RepID=A0A5C7AWL0_9FLAO|nr:hypothetical protein [Seonamhaeicola algicola]TXE13090.1 hypothetical protein FUA26_04660 [Seonamhaeicola algicola]